MFWLNWAIPMLGYCSPWVLLSMGWHTLIKLHTHDLKLISLLGQFLPHKLKKIITVRGNLLNRVSLLQTNYGERVKRVGLWSRALKGLHITLFPSRLRHGMAHFVIVMWPDGSLYRAAHVRTSSNQRMQPHPRTLQAMSQLQDGPWHSLLGKGVMHWPCKVPGGDGETHMAMPGPSP